MTFESCVAVILQHEGGYVFDSNDPGGETNFGISKRTYPDTNIKELKREDAVAIYKKDFWDELRLDEMPEGIRLMVFDCAVNQGKTRAIRILQGALGVKQDGLLGPLTFMAFRESPIGLVFSNMALIRHNHYTSLPHWTNFGKGWSKRLLQITLESFEMI